MQVLNDTKLSDLVELCPGFKEAVNLSIHIDDSKKISAYIPTHKAMEVLNDFAERLHPTSGKRARLLTGTYGTGKSHLALVLLTLYRLSYNHSALEPILKRLSGYPGQRDEIIQARNKINKPFLEVILYGDEGNFNSALLKALDRRLKKDKFLKELLPPTQYSGAVQRIEEIRTGFPQSYLNFEKLVVEGGHVSIEAFIKKLEKYDETAFNDFLEFHIQCCSGAPYNDHHLQKPKDVYRAVCKLITEKHDYSGIVIVWDEFGRYMERMVQDPKSGDSTMIQEFAEYCSNSGYEQTHLYLICHRSFKQYVDLEHKLKGQDISTAQRQDLDKIAGRYNEFQLKTEDEEIFRLIDKVIIHESANDLWNKFERKYESYFHSISEYTNSLKIFPAFSTSDIYKIITTGCYPLHPLAAYCLPRLAEFVAQNERTIFSFLSSDGVKTLGNYLKEQKVMDNDEIPPVFTMDMLWDFFEVELERDLRTKSIVRKLKTLISGLSNDDILARRILKMIAVHQSIETDKFVPTRDVIFFALNLSASERESYDKKIDELSSGDSRTLILSRSNNSYRFFASSGNIITAIEKMMKTRKSIVKLDDKLRRHFNEMFFIDEINTTGYNDDKHMNRSLVPIICPINYWEAARNDIFKNLSQGDFKDGYYVVLIYEDSIEKENGINLIQQDLNHPQILTAIPLEPIRWQHEMCKLDSLEMLEKDQPAIYGTGADGREEWEEIYRDQREVIQNIFQPAINIKEKKLEFYYEGELKEKVFTDTKLKSLASSIMHKVFPDIIVITNDKLISISGNDTYAKYRKDVINKLLKPDAGNLLSGETNTTHKHIIDALLKNNQILRKDKKTKGYKIDCPKESDNPAAYKLWKVVEEFLINSKTFRKASELIETLKSPPFGLRERSISLILAAVWRNYILKGNISLICQSKIINTINADELESIALKSDLYYIKHIEIGALEEMILEGTASAYDINILGLDGFEKIEAVKKELSRWWMSLPQCARDTNAYLEAKPEISKILRKMIFTKISSSDIDARDILFKEFIDTFQMNKPESSFDSTAVTKIFNIVRNDFEKVKHRFEEKIMSIVKEVFGNDISAVTGIINWYSNLPQPTKNAFLHGSAGLLLSKCRGISEYEMEQEQGLITTLSVEIMANIAIENWKDETLIEFNAILRTAKIDIENYKPPTPVQTHISGDLLPTPPPPDFIRISIKDKDEVVTREFKRVEKLSGTGNTLQNALKGLIDGMRGALNTGEYETILTGLLKEYLK